MTGKKSTTRAKPEESTCMLTRACADERDDCDMRYESVVKGCVESYLKVHAEDISRARTKEDVARYSYGGGMLDALYVVHGVLGTWGAEQLCQELERESNAEPRAVRSGGMSIQVRAAPDGPAITAEQAKELGEKVLGWLLEQDSRSAKKKRDPMYG